MKKVKNQYFLKIIQKLSYYAYLWHKRLTLPKNGVTAEIAYFLCQILPELIKIIVNFFHRCVYDSSYGMIHIVAIRILDVGG